MLFAFSGMQNTHTHTQAWYSVSRWVWSFYRAEQALSSLLPLFFLLYECINTHTPKFKNTSARVYIGRQKITEKHCHVHPYIGTSTPNTMHTNIFSDTASGVLKGCMHANTQCNFPREEIGVCICVRKDREKSREEKEGPAKPFIKRNTESKTNQKYTPYFVCLGNKL